MKIILKSIILTILLSTLSGTYLFPSQTGTNNIAYVIMSLVGLIFTVIMWDRRSMMASTAKQASEDAKKMIEEKEKKKDEILLKYLLKKADKNILNNIMLSLKEIYKNNKEAREIFAKHHIEFS